MLPTTSSPSDLTPTIPSLGSILARFAHHSRSSIKRGFGGEVDGIVADVADKLTAELGIKPWYSMHLMNMCEGTYTTSAAMNVSSCTYPRAMCMHPI